MSSTSHYSPHPLTILRGMVNEHIDNDRRDGSYSAIYFGKHTDVAAIALRDFMLRALPTA